jgi:cystathionine beta-lyase/cystathionine gamma-synthase
MAASLGATDSLVLPPQLLASRDLDLQQQQRAGMAAGTVRLSIGLEDVDDLIADLRQALDGIQGGRNLE